MSYAQVAPINISAPTFTRGTPSTFIVPLTVNDLTGRGITAFQFHLDYTPTVIDPSGSGFGCSTSGTISGNAGSTATCNVETDGTLLVAVHGSNVMTGSGTVLNLIFNTDATAVPGDTSPLNFSEVGFFSSQGEAQSTSTDGRVTLVAVTTAAEVSLSGRVSSYEGRGVGNATVTISGGDSSNSVTVLTRRTGVYRIDGLKAGGSYIVTVSQPRYRFEPKAVHLDDSVSGFDFVAAPFN